MITLLCFSLYMQSAFSGIAGADAFLQSPYDTRCDYMKCQFANVNPATNSEQKDYFYKKAPKIIHQIWFGDQSKLEQKNINQWKSFAKRFGYKHKLWTEKDFPILKTFMNPKNFELVHTLLTDYKKLPIKLGCITRGYRGCSNIVRYELLKKFGGVYLDCDMLPPKDKNGRMIDLETIVSFRGLTIMTEHDARNIGTSIALFVANGFIISAAQHPVITSLVNQVYENYEQWCYTNKQDFNSVIVSGPFFFNKVLFGCYNIVPSLYLHRFYMLHPYTGS